MSTEERLERIEEMLKTLLDRKTLKEYYSIEEFAVIVGKAPFTVREWARLGRISAEKRRSGRGKYAAWVIRHTELQRYEKEGLLPELHASLGISPHRCLRQIMS